jgi:hypothetical protein
MRLAGWLLGGVLVAGAIAIGLAVADVRSPARTAFVLLFVILGPPIAIGGLLRSFEPLARVVLAATCSLVLLALTAMIMVAGGFWSPTGGLVAVAVVTAICAAVQWPPVGRRLRAGADNLARRAPWGPASESPLAEDGASPEAV